MSCYHPRPAYKSAAGEVKVGYDDGRGRKFEVPCGRCVGCKLDRSRAWTVRIMHEAQMFDSNLFLTLTYSPEAMPKSLSLEYSDFQGFMKRLRRRVRGVGPGPDGGRPVRFFVAGEYGGQSCRPHFHAILFNAWFKDQQSLVNGTFRSSLCEELWARGNVVIGTVTARSAAYVAGYCLKKVHGREAREHYEDVADLRTGELSSRRPEFVVMSRNPGIGFWWYRRFAEDLFPADHAVTDGRRYKVPRYYMEKYRLEADAAEFERVMEARYERAAAQLSESTEERRAVREVVAYARATQNGERGL